MRASLPPPLAWIDALIERLGKALTWLVLIMMLTEFSIVVLRYLFNVSNTPMQESVMYLHATVFLLAAGYTLKHDGHVRVDIFYRSMSMKKKAWVDLMGTVFLLLPVMIFVVMASLGYVEKSWRILEGSPESGGLPGVFLLKTLIPVFAILMILQGLVEITRNLLIIRGHTPLEDDHDHPEEYV
ncbi:TRAP transporter small permease subunit [Halomonas sp. M20]|uniref:TRAP transporter small permease subunit n=1 Tax=Halomonas sp. M20 TaxID=2763264 RepID=UPI001D0B6467|nr:TRAP transporter small permease subunit [Halomonas sp. M20]